MKYKIIFIVFIFFQFSWSQDFLSEEELTWLKAHKDSIRFGIYKPYPPVEFIDEAGKHRGITADFLNRMEELLQVKFKRVVCHNWVELLHNVYQHKVDFVGCIQKTFDRTQFLNFSRPYIQIPNIIIVRNDITQSLDLSSLKGKRVTAVEGYANIEYVLQEMPDLKFIPAKDDASGLQMVSFGHADAMITDLAVASYYIQKLGINNLQVAGQIDFTWELRFAVRKDWPIFNTIIEKALNEIPEEEQKAIYNKWIPLETKGFIKWQEFWIVIIGISLLAFLLISVIYFWNQTLKKQVQQKTRQLQNELNERKKIERNLIIHNTFLALFIEKTETEIFPALLKELCKTFKATVTTIGYLDQENKLHVAFLKWPEEHFETRIYNEDEWLALPLRAVLQEYKTLQNEELTQILPERFRIPFKEAVITSLPLGKEVFGFFGIFLQEQQISSDEINLLQQIAHFISPTLNAQLKRLWEEEKRLKSEEERAWLEAQYQHAQKMESLGTLAGGIAHDFNNILSSMIGYTELSLLNPQLEPRLKHNLEQILKATFRARDLVKQILAFSRQGKQELKTFSINPLVKETVKLLRSIIPSTIEINMNISQSPLYIQGDSTQVHQIFVNLITNAFQAIKDTEGQIDISVQKVTLENQLVNRWFTVQAGAYCEIKICDTGIGIPQENMDRIFDPFFTTKDKEKGTGLGLATVHNIVKSHNGFIDVQSKVGKGSCFKILLPLKEEPQIVSETSSSSEIWPRGQGNILFVDDEPALVELHSHNLQNLGYTVFSFTDSGQALEYLKEDAQNIDLVISDVSMPKIGGIRLIEEIRKIREDMPVILCTGFSDKIDAESAFQKFKVKAFLMKPVDLTTMAQTVHKILNSKT